MRIRELLSEAVAFDTNNIRLVRIQPDLQGIGKDQNGIYLHRYGAGKRNTVHFVINGVVASHEMGSWENANVVIIVDPKNIDAPMSGARLEDTWYHLGEDGKLYIKNPVILAPPGIENPNKIPVTSYSGDRNKAVQEYLKSQGINPLPVSRNSIAGIDLSDYKDTTSDIIKKYGIGGETVSDQHVNTLDSRAEDIERRVENLLKAAESEGYFINDPGFSSGEVPRTQIARELIDKIFKDIDEFIKNKPNVAKRATKYYQTVKSNLQNLYKQTLDTDKKYKESKFLFILPNNETVGPDSLDNLEKIAISYQVHYPDYMDKIFVARAWPHEGKPYQKLSSIDRMFTKVLEPYKKKQPSFPPLPKQNSNNELSLGNS